MVERSEAQVWPNAINWPSPPKDLGTVLKGEAVTGDVAASNSGALWGASSTNASLGKSRTMNW